MSRCRCGDRRRDRCLDTGATDGRPSGDEPGPAAVCALGAEKRPHRRAARHVGRVQAGAAAPAAATPPHRRLLLRVQGERRDPRQRGDCTGLEERGDVRDVDGITANSGALGIEGVHQTIPVLFGLSSLGIDMTEYNESLRVTFDAFVCLWICACVRMPYFQFSFTLMT